LLKTMNAWLSGMSPAAAAVASAWRAEGVVAVADVVAACVDVTVCVDDAVVEVTGAFVFGEPPQALSASAPARSIRGLSPRIARQMLAPGA
jgi:hypothetical protein